MGNKRGNLYLTPAGNFYLHMGMVPHHGQTMHCFQLVKQCSLMRAKAVLLMSDCGTISQISWLHRLKLVGVNYQPKSKVTS